MRVKRQCPCCLTVFISGRKDALFCKKTCAQSFYRFQVEHFDSGGRTPEALEAYRLHRIEQLALIEESKQKLPVAA